MVYVVDCSYQVWVAIVLEVVVVGCLKAVGKEIKEYVLPELVEWYNKWLALVFDDG